MNTGEIRRCFWRHKVYRDDAVYAVELDPEGLVMAALKVEPAVMCPHMLEGLELDLDAGGTVDKDRKDYELYEPTCHDSAHLLGDIGAAGKDCAAAETEWKAADGKAKALKKIFELKQDKLRQVVREATDPTPLPLFDAPKAPPERLDADAA